MSCKSPGSSHLHRNTIPARFSTSPHTSTLSSEFCVRRIVAKVANGGERWRLLTKGAVTATGTSGARSAYGPPTDAAQAAAFTEAACSRRRLEFPRAVATAPGKPCSLRTRKPAGKLSTAREARAKGVAVPKGFGTVLRPVEGANGLSPFQAKSYSELCRQVSLARGCKKPG